MTPEPSLRATHSRRPDQTARIMADTGLDEATLHRLVHRFYERVRADARLGPIFAARITNWAPHLDRMVAFWSSVALMTGRYHGAPVPAHAGLPVGRDDFDRWLALFRATADEVCTPAGARHVIERAERIAQSLHQAVQDHQRIPAMPPSLR
ncbi:MAG: hemoglobin [Rhodobacteraceae bacterium HLUCCA12]|nr:MAG: hemoglobin [Rhodobacteraceae bacterium HLUCCA12]